MDRPNIEAIVLGESFVANFIIVHFDSDFTMLHNNLSGSLYDRIYETIIQFETVIMLECVWGSNMSGNKYNNIQQSHFHALQMRTTQRQGNCILLVYDLMSLEHHALYKASRTDVMEGVWDAHRTLLGMD